ncbi:hypothetical protein D3C73_794500 [compost metagenome]
MVQLAAARFGLQRAAGALELGPVGAALGRLEPTRLELQRVPAQPRAPTYDQNKQGDGCDHRQPAERRQGSKKAAAHG